MLQLNFTPFPVLSTERLLLREINTTDAKEIFFLRSDKRVLQYLGREPAKSIDDAVTFIDMIKNNNQSGDGVLWGIQLENNPALIGTICYWNIQKENYRAEIGYVLHPNQHGKGIMNEALKAVLNYGFEKMKLHSVEANVSAENIASIKLLEKSGFVREGYFKENYFFNGKFLDSAVYSILSTYN